MVKSSSLSRKISHAIRERGPLTVAAFMDLALYDSELGYYAREARRTGRAGDFFTSVDVGAVFGELLEVQIAEMCGLLGDASVDLVEAGAGNGRLSADILEAARRRDPLVYERIRLHLVEAGAAARAAQRDTLGDYSARLVYSSDTLPVAFEGVLLANELLDAMPVHQVVMRENGLRETYVTTDHTDGRGRVVEADPSTPALSEYLDRAGVQLEPGWRVEINLNATEWIRTAARSLRRGFLLIIDYGHSARELYSATHSAGTLTSFSRHTSDGPGRPTDIPSWLDRPGEQDITAHVDFTSVRAAAEAEGLTTIGFLDQTYFLLGLFPHLTHPENPENPENVSRLRQLKTLLMPGGLGSTHKVLILGKGVGVPSLRGCSFRVRVT